MHAGLEPLPPRLQDVTSYRPVSGPRPEGTAGPRRPRPSPSSTHGPLGLQAERRSRLPRLIRFQVAAHDAEHNDRRHLPNRTTWPCPNGSDVDIKIRQEMRHVHPRETFLRMPSGQVKKLRPMHAATVKPLGEARDRVATTPSARPPENHPPDSFFFGSCLASRFRSLSGQGEEVLAPARSCGAVVFTLTRKGVLHVLARPSGPDGVPCRATRSRRAASPLWHPRLGLRSDRPPPLARASRWRWLAGGVRCPGQTNLHDDACERAWVCR